MASLRFITATFGTIVVLNASESAPFSVAKPAAAVLEAERAALASWVSGELRKHGASKLEEKLRYPSYGNYVDHDQLFSGEVKAKAFSPARRWLVSPQIFHERVIDVFRLEGRDRQLASPLSWTSFHGVRDNKSPAFRSRLDELFLQYPNSAVARKAAAGYLAEVKTFIQNIIKAGQHGADTSTFALQASAFPEPGQSETGAHDTIPTYAYNWCVSQLTPMGVSGVIWVPSESNLGEDPAHYAAELEIYAKSLPVTYGHETIQFLYAQPASSLVEGITAPRIPGAKSTSLINGQKASRTSPPRWQN